MVEFEEVIIKECWDNIKCETLQEYNNVLDKFIVTCEEFKKVCRGDFKSEIIDDPKDLTISLSIEYSALVPKDVLEDGSISPEDN